MNENPYARYDGEAPAPTATTTLETIRYIFDEIQRRAWYSTKGLDDAQLNHDPGHGAMSIGALLHHQLQLVRFLIYPLDADAFAALPIPPEVGSEGKWRLQAILPFREKLNETFRRVFAAATDEALLAKRPDLFPPEWAEFPVLMRLSRPLVDIATHVGQVNYARRQLGNPQPPDPIRDRKR
jgi:hypothetical protein